MHARGMVGYIKNDFNRRRRKFLRFLDDILAQWMRQAIEVPALLVAPVQTRLGLRLRDQVISPSGNVPAWRIAEVKCKRVIIKSGAII
jgi:hypothetical protein